MVTNKWLVTSKCFITSSPAAQNPCARFLLCCLKCCFWCLEKFIKFLNRNAYIMVSSPAEPLLPLFTCSYDLLKCLDWIGLYQCYLSFYLTSKTFVYLSDRHLWEKLLRFSQKCFPASHEKYNKVCWSCIFNIPKSPGAFFSNLRRQKDWEWLSAPCRVVVLDKVTDLLLFFGKLLVVGGVGKKSGGKTCSSSAFVHKLKFQMWFLDVCDIAKSQIIFNDGTHVCLIT